MEAHHQSSPARTESGRLPSLDGLRAIAALLVVFAHSHVTVGWPGWRLLEELRKTLSGFVAVQMFFVISGFIITRLLLNERTKVGSISLRRFWGRRFLRIVPPLAVYLACLSLLKALGAIEVSTLSQVGSLFFFRNHLPETDLFNIHCWSLSVEEQFYLIWPFCVAFLPLDKLRRVAWMVMVVAFLTRAAMNA
ncbi:MAG TPA: acyltransferase, partial [Verrucomicrobium sp.]|nr:acyltransferase [Verrucomicrobium sp.]